MWFPVCWATLPVSVFWLWDFCTPGTPRPWGFGHLFVRFFIILVERERKKTKKNRYRMKRMTLWDYTPIKTHLTLELPYWSSFVHQWIADKWKCILFKKKKKIHILCTETLFVFLPGGIILCHWLDVRYANSAELFWSLFSCFLPVHVHKEKSNKKYH